MIGDAPGWCKGCGREVFDSDLCSRPDCMEDEEAPPWPDEEIDSMSTPEDHAARLTAEAQLAAFLASKTPGVKGRACGDWWVLQIPGEDYAAIAANLADVEAQGFEVRTVYALQRAIPNGGVGLVQIVARKAAT